jgi:hypothetical protein
MTADSRQQTADSRQQTADSRQQAADNRQLATDNRQQTAASRQEVDRRQKTPDRTQQTADSNKQTATSRQQTADRVSTFSMGILRESSLSSRAKSLTDVSTPTNRARGSSIKSLYDGNGDRDGGNDRDGDRVLSTFTLKSITCCKNIFDSVL